MSISKEVQSTMKRYIRSSKYITSDILFDSTITVDVEVKLPISKAVTSASDTTFELFPGIEKFREDVANILENEYKFEVIREADYNMQRGYVTNRPEELSASVYFNCYYDLSNAQIALNNSGIKLQKAPDPDKIFCFIHIRFSEHELNDTGDLAHKNFIKENAEKYISNNPQVTHSIPDESIVVSEKMLYRYYREALDDLKDKIDATVIYWVKAADRYKLLDDSQ